MSLIAWGRNHRVPLPSLPRETFNLAIIDIECCQLYSHDFIFCCGFKPLGREPYIIDLRSLPRDGAMRDRPIVREIKRHLEFYEGWIGWNSDSFDVAMLNDRLQMAGEQPLERRYRFDLMKLIKYPKSRTQRASLDWCAKQFGCPHSKTDMNIMEWMKARDEAIINAADEIKGQWRKGHENYDRVIEHNRADLQVTEWMFGFLKPRLGQLNKR